MIKMKKIFALAMAVALAASSAVFAQSNDSQTVLNEVCKNIAKNKISKGNFNQTKKIKKINREIKSSGTFIVAVEDGILWNTQKPIASSMAITKSGIVQTSAQGKKSVMAAGGNATFEQVSTLITSLFNGNADALTQNFDIDFKGTADNWNATLVPKDSSVKGFISQIEMAGRSSIDSVVLNEPSGDFTKYEFSNYSYPKTLSDEEKSLFSGK